MAGFNNFGTALGLSYKYDYGARFERQRQQSEANRQHALDQEKTQERQEQKEILEEQRNFQQDQRHASLIEGFYDDADIGGYNTRFQTAFSNHIEDKATKLGAIINTPGWSQNPKLRAEYNKYYAEAKNMPGFSDHVTAQTNYEQFLKDSKEGNLSSDEEEKVRDEWLKYQGGDKNYFNYMKKPDFVITNSISDYLSGISAYPTYNKAAGTNTYGFDQNTLTTYVANFIDTNESEIMRQWGQGEEGIGEAARAIYGTPEKWIRSLMSEELKIGKVTKAGNPPGTNNLPKVNYTTNPTAAGSPFMKNIVGATEGTDPGIINFIPYSQDGNVKRLQDRSTVFFGNKDAKTGKMVHGESLNLPDGMDIFMTNAGAANVGEWKTFSDGHKYAKVQMYLTNKAVEDQNNSEDKWIWEASDNYIKDFFKKNNITVEEIKSGYGGEKIHVFEGWVPLNITDSKSQSEYNKSFYGTDPIKGTPTTQTNTGAPPTPAQVLGE